MLALFDKPTAGKIVIEDIDDIFKLTEKERIRYHQETIGYVSQFTVHNLIPNWSVENNIKIPIKLRNKLTREESNKRIDEVLDFIGLKDKKKRQTNYLSGGESQKLSLAVALANNPKLILADEPTGELDSNNTLIIADLLKSLVENYNTTVLVVTHNSLLANKSQISWNMEDGRITGLYKKSEDFREQKDRNKYFTFVDDQGNLRLPKEVLIKAKIKNSVSIEFNEGTKKVELTPEKD